MSNSTSDASVRVLITKEFNWQSLEEQIRAFEPNEHSESALYRAFYWSESQLGFDPFLLTADKDNKENFPADNARAILLNDLEILRERVSQPTQYTRSSDNYDTYGYGFEATRVGDGLLLSGTYNEFCAAAGEIPETEITNMEHTVFARLITLGLAAAASV